VAASAPSNLRPGPRPAGRLGTEEYHSAPLPPAQEAAVLYAGNHANAAIALLKGEIKDAAGRNNKQAWLMLFDLYQVAQNRPEFEALSMLFSVRFEQSSPAWNDSADASGDPRRPQSRERKDLFVLKPAADGALAAEIEKFAQFAAAQGTVRLDVSRVGAISPEEATLLATALGNLRRKQVPMWFNNLEALETILRAAFNERATEDQRPFWLLLFELFVLQGKDTEFEELGMEYAVAFEISPPSWEVYVNTVSAAAARTTPAAAAAAAPAEGTRVRFYEVDGSTFIDGDYLIKGVAGRLLWALLAHHQREGRVEFTNREMRLDPSLDLPAYRDNFESRLILLKRRLDEQEAPVRIDKTSRGCFRLVVDGPLLLERA